MPPALHPAIHTLGSAPLLGDHICRVPINALTRRCAQTPSTQGYVGAETPAISGPQPGSTCYVGSPHCHDMFDGTAPLGDARKHEVWYSTNYFTQVSEDPGWAARPARSDPPSLNRSFRAPGPPTRSRERALCQNKNKQSLARPEGMAVAPTHHRLRLASG